MGRMPSPRDSRNIWPDNRSEQTWGVRDNTSVQPLVGVSIDLVQVDLPWNGDGLTVIDVGPGGYSKLKFTIRNDSGKALSDQSWIAVKFLTDHVL